MKHKNSLVNNLQRTLGSNMNNKDFQKMIRLFSELDELIKKYDKFVPREDTPSDAEPIMFPDEIYDEICCRLKTNEIGLLGIS